MREKARREQKRKLRRLKGKSSEMVRTARTRSFIFFFPLKMWIGEKVLECMGIQV